MYRPEKAEGRKQDCTVLLPISGGRHINICRSTYKSHASKAFLTCYLLRFKIQRKESTDITGWLGPCNFGCPWIRTRITCFHKTCTDTQQLEEDETISMFREACYLPEWMPMRISKQRCRGKSSSPRQVFNTSKAVFAISLACRSPFLIGRPLAIWSHIPV